MKNKNILFALFAFILSFSLPAFARLVQGEVINDTNKTIIVSCSEFVVEVAPTKDYPIHVDLNDATTDKLLLKIVDKNNLTAEPIFEGYLGNHDYIWVSDYLKGH